MNFEALGKYHHLSDTRQNNLRKLHIMAKSVVALGQSLDNYNPPYLGIDNINENIASAEVAIEEIKTLVKQVGEMWLDIQRLKEEFNLP